MHCKFKIFSLFIIVVIAGCGGGGGQYYPPRTAVNIIGLKKLELAKSNLEKYSKKFFPITYEKTRKREEVRSLAFKRFGKERYFSEFYFNEKTYCLQLWDSKPRITDHKGNKVFKSLEIPRYGFCCSAFSIYFENKEYLVAYIEQQSTSHSSTLFVLDREFNIVYKEHLLGAVAIGVGTSEKHGDCIILEHEDFWFPNGLDKPRVNVNGEWVYYLPKTSDAMIQIKD